MSNCITDDIKSCNNGGFIMFWAEICLFIVFLFLKILPHFKVFISIHEYANSIIYISTIERKACV